MMTYLATRLEADGPYPEVFDADSERQAIDYCKARGWVFEGEFFVTPSARDIAWALDLLNGNSTKH